MGEEETKLIENQERKNMIKWVMNSIEHINKKVLPYLDRKDATRRNVRYIIFNNNELEKRIPALGVYREIIGMHDEHKIDPVEFIDAVRKISKKIEAVDDELAAKVGPIYLNRSIMHYLRSRYSELKKVKDIHAFLRELYSKWYAEFVSFENKQLFNEMDKLFTKKIEEIDYVRRYSREVMNWNSFPEPKNVEYYAQKIRFFLYGGYGNYKGLVTDFKDRKILGEIQKRNMIKQLLNYSLERKFIADRIIEVRLGWQEGNWDHFYKFFRNVKKHAKNLVVKFGNVDFANRILKDKKKFKEDPKEWLNALQEMETQLSNRYYFENKVLKPTTKELVKILDGSAERIEKEMNKSLNKFRNYMKNVLESVEETPRKKAKEIISHVRSKEKKIMKEWAKIRADFEKLEIKILNPMIRLDNAFDDINKRCTDPGMYLRKIDGIESRQEAWRQHFFQTINRIDVMRTGNIPIAEEMLSLPSLMGAHDRIIKSHDDNLEEDMINLFSKNIPRIMKEAEKASKELDKMLEFINEKNLASLIVSPVIPISRQEKIREGLRLVA